MKKIILNIFLLFLINTSYGQVISLVAGNGSNGYTGDDSLAIYARMDHPWNLTTDDQGNVYVSEQGNSIIRRIDAQTDIISTFVGIGSPGEGTNTDLGPDFAITSPAGITYFDNHIYFCDFGLNKIFKVNLSDSTVHHVAGNGISSYSSDGTDAIQATIGEPEGIDVGTDGLVYFSESYNSIIRRIQTDGTLITIAGLVGTPISLDGPVGTATFNTPLGIALDDNNNIYVAEPLAFKIRKINQLAGLVTTVVGNGSFGDATDGSFATSASISDVHSVDVDSEGNIYIPDVENYKIKKVDVNDGKIYTIAGDGTLGNNILGGDPLTSQIGEPLGIHVDAGSVIYFTDIGYETIKKIEDCIPADSPSIIVSTNDTLNCGDPITLTVIGDLNSQSYWQWYGGECGGNEAGSGQTITPTLNQTTTFHVVSKGTCPSQVDCLSRTIFVKSCDDAAIGEINAFSPNDDGVNDYLHINQASINQTNTVVIYNRWGDEIRSIQNYDNENVFWNGNNEFGGAVEGGTYFYIFESNSVRFSKWITVTK